MNRNMRRGRGAGAGIQRGPLATNHIRNLDEELEILQRRRDLLQREQALLVNEQMFGRKRQYENDHHSQNFIPFNQQATQSFSHLYDDGPGPSFNHGGGGKKRHTINVWDNDTLNTNLNSNNQRFRSYMGPKPQPMSAPKPLMSIVPKPSIGHRISGYPQNVRKNFNPTKVTKPKGKPQNKAKPSPVNAAPLKKALVSSKEKPKEPQVLRADQVPSKQMTGRLELALGEILKEMRKSFCTTEECTLLFNAKHIQRVIKHLIRKRLRNLMLNKVVGPFAEIVALYRENFPQKTDKEIFDSAVLTSGTNEKYLRYSVNRLMGKKLDEMFMKLQEFYEGNSDEGIAKIIESRPSSVKEISKDIEKDEATMTIERQFYDTLVDTLLEVKLPKVLPNYTHTIMKLLENDEEIKKAKQLTKNANEKINEESAIIEINDSEIENEEVEVQPAKKSDNTEDEEGQSKESNSATVKQGNNQEGIDETKNDNLVGKEMENDGVEINTAKTGSNVPTESISIASQYFVKVLGQPILPNRADAYKFLNQFNPVSIKKHKVVQNLLVVGFKNEKDFENAIANSGAVVGSSKLTIKANENQEQNTSLSPKDDDADKNTSISKDVITPDLENQISDLLSSIRKAEEEEKSDDIKTEDISQETNDIKEVKKETQDAKVYTPSNIYEEDSQGLGTIQEDAENKIIEDNKATPENASENLQTQSNGSDKETKNKETGKGTPMKVTSRLSNVTPSIIRTRRASRLAQNN
ncbi:unnamed protein product [Parnassius apollo]|uniref:(apollo) hypothetical protein n=1 Tax=Parnassius apollo TaxID=110799 RepID=A0A8S3YFK9_PARAO|nr:unnamed protein product [Parnassius apollo]